MALSERRTRTYSSALRAQQATQTRRSVVDAAAELFTERGYGATTIDAIAERAGVSRKTVFDSVGGKPQLIKLAYDFAITGDAEPVPLADRPVIAALAATPDPQQRLIGYARLVTQINRRISGVWRALEGAAQSDQAAKDIYERLLAQRRRGAEMAAAGNLAGAALRDGTTLARAADLLWIFTDPTLYDKLVRQCGWSPESFEGWLAQAMTEQLLAAGD